MKQNKPANAEYENGKPKSILRILRDIVPEIRSLEEKLLNEMGVEFDIDRRVCLLVDRDDQGRHFTGFIVKGHITGSEDYCLYSLEINLNQKLPDYKEQDLSSVYGR